MPNKLILLTMMAMLALGACSEDDPFGENGEGGEDGDGEDAPTTELVRGIDIDGVIIYQSIEVPLLVDGELVPKEEIPTAIVQGKDMMVRVLVKREEDWQPREITCRVYLESEEAGSKVVEESGTPSFDSDVANLKTTFAIEVPAEHVVADLKVSISLRESEEDVGDKNGSTKGARWPDEGNIALEPVDPGGPLQLVLFPVQYDADGSGRLPDVSDAQIDLIYDSFYSMYPVADIDITVEDPFPWDKTIGSMGNGWDTLLTAIRNQRAPNGASKKDYYYGLFCPANTLQGFCGMGCVAGLSSLATGASADWARVSIGLGYAGAESVSTMLHEVGHAHGREHAPCGLGGQPSDPKYPHTGGQIGVQGYDLANRVLKDPVQQKDIMSYCKPTWISDYTYNALATRVMAVNTLPRIISPDGLGRWLVLSIDLEGEIKPASELLLDTPPGGEQLTVELTGLNGEAIEVVTGYFSPYSHIPGGLVLFPDPGEAVTGIRVPGYATVPYAGFSAIQ